MWLHRMARLFISQIKLEERKMVIIELGWNDKFILTNEKAIALANILEGAERFEDKYWPAEAREKHGITEERTYHVYPNDKEYPMKIVSNAYYQMAKLAGKPVAP